MWEGELGGGIGDGCVGLHLGSACRLWDAACGWVC